MRFVPVLIAALVLSFGAAFRAHAATPDEMYIDAYRTIEDADQAFATGNLDGARTKYQTAQDALKKMQGSFPSWNSRAVQYRLEYVQGKLKGMPGAKPEPGAETKPASQPATPQAQIAALNEQIAKLQANNSLLEAKLKEALSAQPAAIDPRELAKAEERIKQVEKEKELLKANLEQAQAKQPQAAEVAMLDQTRAELADTKKKLVDAVANVASLSQEKQSLQAANEKLQQQPTANAKPEDKPADLQKALADAQQQAKAQSTTAAATKTQLDNAQETIKAQLGSIADLKAQLASAQQQAAKTPVAANPSSDTDSAARVKQLEQERGELLKKLDGTVKELFEAKNKSSGDQSEFLKRQIGTMQGRLDVLEARKVPYTSEELALFKAPPVQVKAEEPKPARKQIKELPKEAADLVKDAQLAYGKKNYAEAEAKYQQVLQIDPENPVTLGNLAAIQMERGKFQDADANLRKAMAASPDDGYIMSLLGILNFRQEKYDEALDHLSKAAQLDPKNPETQNYLGITLSQKGHREAAETALRKAIQLAPNYAGAHHNLAVVYATQKPPFLELAKYHYQKALSEGHPANPDLEKILKEAAQASTK
jgi:tetratricopeptide (TPR) repeat protein